MYFGVRERTERVRYGVNDDMKPMLPLAMYGTLKDKIKEQYPRECSVSWCSSNRSELHGVYFVEFIEYGVGVTVHRRITNVTYKCLDCLHRENPEKYPYDSS